jgi:hypothetical protein
VSDEKPLHVQVAEALGWEHLRDDGGWRGDGPNWRDGGGVIGMVPRYDTDWAATGPLIEKYRLFVGRYADWSHDGRWYAMQTVAGYPESMPGKDERLERTGTTPLEAVCHLILALKAAGKLEAAS